MDVPTPDEAIAILEEGQAALAAGWTRLSAAELERPATIGGGDWSAKDLIGHLAFWEELALTTLDDWQASRPLSVGAIFAGGSHGVDAANAENQARTAAASLEAVQERATAAHQALLAALRSIGPEEWHAARVLSESTGERSLGELLGGILGAPDRLFGHAFAHVADLQAYVSAVAGEGRT